VEDNARVVAEMLEEDEKFKVPSLGEGQNKVTVPHTTTEMDVLWKICEDECDSYYESGPDRTAIEKARSQLKEIGYERSILAILSNDVKHCNQEDILWQGRTRFRVTLIPDQLTDSRSRLPLSYLGRLEDELKQARTALGSAKESYADESAVAKLANSTSSNDGGLSSVGSSRFADAQSN
jgi:hypothetical protein